MNKKYLILGIILSALMITSCVKDLDVKSIDPNYLLPADVKSKEASKMVLAKIYAGFITRGQDGSDNDVNTDDANFTCLIRAYWNVQELTTDEVKCAWGDDGISGLNKQNWTASNPFLKGVYARLIWVAVLSNDFIRNTNGSTDPDIIKYNAEAHFLRDLAYAYAVDLFGKPAFVTEKDPISLNFFPPQIDRVSLFNYVVNDLKSIENNLGDPKFENYRADKACAWMLLARMYQNAEVYTGTAKWDSCKYYCDKVISNGNYILEPNYRKNFSSDNDASREIIFSLASDGVNIIGATGVSFIIHSSSNGLIPQDSIGMPGFWGGNRTTKQCVNVLIDTLAVYGNTRVVSANDTWFARVPDKRVYLRQLSSYEMHSPGTYTDGIGVFKFTNNRSDGGAIVDYNSDNSSTDFPIFRLAEAYLMRAEALMKSSTPNLNAAMSDVNMIRARAFGNNLHNLTSTAQLTNRFLCDEFGREFFYEGHRRTDLIRFGLFTTATYTWAWKGDLFEGQATDSHFNLFPIPDVEVTANPNIHQNTGY
jgi:starch-binding outer membrane protein, SusD/RagB family